MHIGPIVGSLNMQISSSLHSLAQSVPGDAHARRLEWLLQAVLEIQAMITEADFDIEPLMQRIVDLAETLTGGRGAVVETVDGDEMVCRSSGASGE